VHEPVDHKIELAEIFLTSYTSPTTSQSTGAFLPPTNSAHLTGELPDGELFFP
jgi:hypothetical protein